MKEEEEEELVTIEVYSDGVALITLCNPPLNLLSHSVCLGLKEKYEEAMRKNDVKAIVVTGADCKFSGGFDITAMHSLQDLSQLSWVGVDLLTNIVEGGRKPSVAAIQGPALGGGLELAMCCHARIAAPSAHVGLFELQLGVLPRAGGTQRLPRLVGLYQAIEMMLTSNVTESINAWIVGLLDAIVPTEKLILAARQWALDIANFSKPWTITLRRTDKLKTFGGSLEDTFQIARKIIIEGANNLSHPLKCLDVVKEGIVTGGLAGIYKESEVFRECAQSDTTKALVHIFFSQRATRKVTGVTDLGLVPRPLKKVGIIGRGLMGYRIATSCLLNGIQVVMKEVNEDLLQIGLRIVAANMQSMVTMSEEEFNEALCLLKGTLDYNGFKGVDMVIEAVIDKFLSKRQQICSDLEKICPSICAFVSTSSTVDLKLIAEKIKAKDRVAGARFLRDYIEEIDDQDWMTSAFHYFSPVHVMPLSEIIRTPTTAPQVLVDLLEFSRKIKFVPVGVGNCSGFAVNRTFFAYTQASLLLVDLGVDVYRIDHVVSAFGMYIGPFRLVDRVGLEVSFAFGMNYVEAFPDRVYKSMIFPVLMEDKRLGEKTCKGFYIYDEYQKAKRDPKLREYVDKSRRIANIMPHNMPFALSDEDVIEVIFFPVVNESCRMLEEGVVSKASDLDVATVMGIGFPPYRGGIIFWADFIGAKRIAEKLHQLSKSYGSFFKPCAWLEHCAARGQNLSSHITTMQARL